MSYMFVECPQKCFESDNPAHLLIGGDLRGMWENSTEWARNVMRNLFSARAVNYRHV